MGYKITSSGEIVCDTAQEAVELQRLLAGNHKESAHLRKVRGDQAVASRWTDARYKQFMEIIHGNQKELIKLLLDNPDGKTDKNIRQALRIDNNLKLAGVTSGLVKNAKKVGILDGKEVFIKEVLQQGEEQVLEYRLADEFRAVAERN